MIEGKEYNIEANFKGGLSLLQDLNLAKDVFLLFEGDPLSFIKDLTEWLMEGKAHYRVSFTVSTTQCNGEIKPHKQLDANLPKCEVQILDPTENYKVVEDNTDENVEIIQ